MSDECVFCRISGGHLPAETVYEDDRVMVFHDLNPQAPVHLLIVPRCHFPSLDCPEAADAGLHLSFCKALQSILSRIDPADRDYRLVVNRGSGAGQTVFHLHWHFLAGRPFDWPPG